ncbi:MAG: P-loop NTPase fold protein, partial [Fulvivirga sp.]
MKKIIGYNFLLIALYLVFYVPIHDGLEIILISPILSKVGSNYVNDLVLLGLSLYLLYLLVRSYKSTKRVSFNLLILAILWSIIYSLNRFDILPETNWEFLSFSIIDKVYYLDVTYLTLLVSVISYVLPIGSSHIPVDENLSLWEDNAIENLEEDKFGRSGLVQLVADYIINTNSKKSFNIGISSRWGTGKTSFKNLLSRHLKEQHRDKVIVFEFNPWISQSADKIISDFFSLFKQVLSNYIFNINYIVNSYLKGLNLKGQLGFRLFNSFLTYSEWDESSKLNSLNESIKTTRRKVIVLVEDVDRLSSDEIKGVFKLIRTVANFRNTFFVVGYDQKYIKDTLEIPNVGFYLEKIFQLQFELSKIPETYIEEILAKGILAKNQDKQEEVASVFGNLKTNFDAISTYLTGKPINGPYISSLFATVREVNRFINYFTVNYSLLKDEVVFQEYLVISVLKFKYPLLIEGIIENRHVYLVQGTFEQGLKFVGITSSAI